MGLFTKQIQAGLGMPPLAPVVVSWVIGGSIGFFLIGPLVLRKISLLYFCPASPPFSAYNIYIYVGIYACISHSCLKNDTWIWHFLSKSQLPGKSIYVCWQSVFLGLKTWNRRSPGDHRQQLLARGSFGGLHWTQKIYMSGHLGDRLRGDLGDAPQTPRNTRMY